MDIALVLVDLGFNDQEMSAASDMSSRAAMVATWRHSRPAPTQAEMDASWAVVGQAMAMVDLRTERDRLLKESDDRFLADTPPGRASQAWKDYRQALRDLPADTPDPANPTWPTVPA